MKDVLKKVIKETEESLDEAADFAEEAIEETGESLSEAADFVEEVIEETGESLGEAADFVEEGIEKTGKSLSKTLEKAGKLMDQICERMCKISGAEGCSCSGGIGYSTADGFHLTDGRGHPVDSPEPQTSDVPDNLKRLTLIDPENRDVIFGTVSTSNGEDNGVFSKLPRNLLCLGTSCVDREPAGLETPLDVYSLTVGIKEWMELGDAPFWIT